MVKSFDIPGSQPASLGNLPTLRDLDEQDLLNHGPEWYCHSWEKGKDGGDERGGFSSWKGLNIILNVELGFLIGCPTRSSKYIRGCYSDT